MIAIKRCAERPEKLVDESRIGGDLSPRIL